MRETGRQWGFQNLSVHRQSSGKREFWLLKRDPSLAAEGMQ